MTKYRTSKTEKVLRAIAKRPMTAAQIRAKFDTPNVSATINDIENLGFPVARVRKGRYVVYSV